ncbi:hypothetical protein ACC745_38855, partial [Rhizobium ruizarguesonis]
VGICDQLVSALDHVVIGLNCQAADEGLEVRIAYVAFRQHANAIGEQIGNAHDLEDEWWWRPLREKVYSGERLGVLKGR